MLLIFLVCVGPNFVAQRRGRTRWARRFLAWCGRVCGVDVRTRGRLGGPRTLLLANHTSWLDIPVLATATVRLLDPLDPRLGRKAMAKAAHDAIAAALAPSGIAPAAL